MIDVCFIEIRVSPAVVMVCFLRYAQMIEHSHRCWINTGALVSGCANAVGLVMVGNFQVTVCSMKSNLWSVRGKRLQTL